MDMSMDASQELNRSMKLELRDGINCFEQELSNLQSADEFFLYLTVPF